MATAHAKHRPPSAAKRWLSCPFSAHIAAMYPNTSSEKSLKGDYWHELMEDKIIFGTLPKNIDPDAADAMDDLYAYVKQRIEAMGGPGKVRVFVEVELSIPETGEFGTVDILLVSEREIEIIDLKSGYVAVNVKMNPQMMIYLLGALAIHGERKSYRVTIFQPLYDHVDGPFRSFDPSEADIEWLRREIKYSMENDDECKAGRHCKETYCPHRGACAPFSEYVKDDLVRGWHTSEVRGIPDAELAIFLDAADELSGWRNELRSEAMRRIMNMDRHIEGYKVVKGRKQRAILPGKELDIVNTVNDKLGTDWAIKLFPDLSTFLSALGFPLSADDAALKFIGTPKHIEDVIRQYAREHSLPRGGWQGVYDNTVGPYIRETAMGLTLEKSIDGRPAHKRGSEFGSIMSPTPTSNISL